MGAPRIPSTRNCWPDTLASDNVAQASCLPCARRLMALPSRPCPAWGQVANLSHGLGRAKARTTNFDGLKTRPTFPLAAAAIPTTSARPPSSSASSLQPPDPLSLAHHRSDQPIASLRRTTLLARQARKRVRAPLRVAADEDAFGGRGAELRAGASDGRGGQRGRGLGGV